MSKEWMITKKSDSTIVIDEAWWNDSDTIETKSPKDSETVGRTYPYISINGYTFKQEELINVVIDQTSFVPTIRVKAKLIRSSVFMTMSYPKDGDLINVYISGRDDLFASIRADFLITDAPTKKLKEAGNHGQVVFEGTLNVPGLDADKSQAIKGTSFETMKTLAVNLGLGFSTNETATDDEQVWISPNITQREFIKEITIHAWKDENSFFTSFIDIYYTLNFINANTQFSFDATVLRGLQERTESIKILSGDDDGEVAVQDEASIIFSNDKDAQGGNFFFNEYKIINKSSQIAKQYGYKFNTVFYELNTNKEWIIPIEPLVTANRPDDTFLLKGRAHDETYKTQVKTNWQGIQYTGDDHNVHSYYIYAKSHNKMNLVEIDKLNIAITLDKMNLNIQRFGRYPIQFFVVNDPGRIDAINEPLDVPEEDKQDVAVDKFYTGFYVLKGLKIIFDTRYGPNNQLKEELVFTRREWPTPL